LKKAYQNYLIALLIFIVYSSLLLSLSFINLQPQIFLTFVFLGYFILGVIFGFIFRKRFLSGSVTAFPLTFLGWLIAFALFSSLDGFTSPVQSFSEDFQNALIAGLFFSTITFVGALLTAMAFKLFQSISKRIKTSSASLEPGQ